jgi:hypothetical protein
MEMNVKDALTGGCPVELRECYSVGVRRFFHGAGNFLCRFDQMFGAFGRELEYVSRRLFGNDESVAV